jgi:hypothetical protein
LRLEEGDKQLAVQLDNTQIYVSSYNVRQKKKVDEAWYTQYFPGFSIDTIRELADCDGKDN